MKNSNDISSLIRYFVDRVSLVEKRNFDGNIGSEPVFPSMIVFLGSSAKESADVIAERLSILWPQYIDELLFLSITDPDGTDGYQKLEYIENTVQASNLWGEDLSAEIGKLFSSENHFQKHNKLLIYFVLDTADMDSVDDFKDWSNAAKAFLSDLEFETEDLADMLLIYLDEGFGKKRRIADALKNSLAEKIPEFCDSVFLLSNRRSDNAIMQNRTDCSRAVSCIIAVSNSSETVLTNALFTSKLFTVGYSCEEKPSEAVARIVVKKLIDHLSKEKLGDYTAVSIDDRFIKRLGLTDKHVNAVVDKYVDDNANALIPSAEQLLLFPRRYCQFIGDPLSYSGREFNELTMSGWKCYLDTLVKRITEKLGSDLSMQMNWKNKYKEILLSGFSANELIWIVEHLDMIRQTFSDLQVPSDLLDLKTAALARLKYSISEEPDIVALFEGVITECGKKALAFIEKWNDMQRTVCSMHTIRDDNIVRFYDQKVVLFFDQNGNDIAKEFGKLIDADNLFGFLNETINKIIDFDDIFTLRFEDELEARFKESTNTASAKEHIKRKLICENVPVFYSKIYNFGSPVISCILLKTGTNLHKTLSAELPKSTLFHNTGTGRAAEAIYIYELNAENLTNERGAE